MSVFRLIPALLVAVSPLAAEAQEPTTRQLNLLGWHHMQSSASVPELTKSFAWSITPWPSEQSVALDTQSLHCEWALTQLQAA